MNPAAGRCRAWRDFPCAAVEATQRRLPDRRAREGSVVVPPARSYLRRLQLGAAALWTPDRDFLDRCSILEGQLNRGLDEPRGICATNLTESGAINVPVDCCRTEELSVIESVERLNTKLQSCCIFD